MKTYSSPPSSPSAPSCTAPSAGLSDPGPRPRTAPAEEGAPPPLQTGRMEGWKEEEEKHPVSLKNNISAHKHLNG